MRKHIISLALVAVFGGVSAAHAATLSIGDPSFETTANPLPDGGDSVSGVWNSYGDGGLNFTVTSDVAHSGTNSITNRDGASGTPGFTLLYQPVLGAESDIDGHTFNYAFWVYYDATLPGQNQATDSIGWDFSARDLGNNDTADVSGTIQASSLVSKTWTEFTGTMSVDDSISGFTSQKIEAVLIAPAGKWYADDVSLTDAVATPEPASLTLLGMGAAGLLMRRQHA